MPPSWISDLYQRRNELVHQLKILVFYTDISDRETEIRANQIREEYQTIEQQINAWQTYTISGLDIRA